jgi:hypothetical protein
VDQDLKRRLAGSGPRARHVRVRAGVSMASSKLQNVILSEVPRERAGSASGVATTVNSLGDAHSGRWALLAAAGLLATGAAASFAIPVRKPQPEPHGAPTAPGPSRRQGISADEITSAPSQPAS